MLVSSLRSILLIAIYLLLISFTIIFAFITIITITIFQYILHTIFHYCYCLLVFHLIATYILTLYFLILTHLIFVPFSVYCNFLVITVNSDNRERIAISEFKYHSLPYLSTPISKLCMSSSPLFFESSLAATIMVLMPVSCDHVIFNFDGKKAGDGGLTCWCHLSIVMCDRTFHEIMGWEVTCFCCCCCWYLFVCFMRWYLFYLRMKDMESVLLFFYDINRPGEILNCNALKQMRLISL